MTGNEVRKTFLDFFEDNGHRIVKSSSLIPKNDPTLLFTNAGMVQFKNTFLGHEKREYTRAASSQKCVRAGGKHNDLENVGYTARHHTFFEMLGNFSFGDYFKDKAIDYAWKLITGIYKVPENKLWVTVYLEDDEASDIWENSVGVDKSRIVRMSEKDNFWSMGETGPCGPCSEIIVDQGERFSCGKSDCAVGCDCDRYLEIWNLVFMQYNRDASGKLTRLPNPSIDTGMGLERITAVLQGVDSNYDTDLLRDVISSFESFTGKRYGENNAQDISLRVLSDHIRAVTFLISDGVLPSNEGRGYVLRRILRRAVRHLRKLGVEEPTLYRVSPLLAEKMGDIFTELLERMNFVTSVIKNEEERFFETIDRGLELLNIEIEKHKGDKIIPGEVAFKLYDTYGFPLDLTQDIAKDTDINVDIESFNKFMELQRTKSRKAWKGSGDEELTPLYREFASGGLTTIFTGYDKLSDEAVVNAIIKSGVVTDNAEKGDSVDIVFDKTPFYAESGGQVGDTGFINGEKCDLQVLDTQKPLPDIYVHKCIVKKGVIWVGDKVELRVDATRRARTKAHHTSTHMLQATLKEILGDHVAQAGSYVGPDRLRFDFSHFESIDQNLLHRIEDVINERLRLDDKVRTETDVPYDEAIKSGATAIFEEKYGDKVRVVSVGDYSRELCGGTHLSTTGEGGLFKIIGETSSAAGVRRIEALCGEACWNYMRNQDSLIKEASAILKTPSSDVLVRIKKLLEENEKYKKEIEAQRSGSFAKQSKALMDKSKKLNGISVISTVIPHARPDDLRTIWDDLKSNNKSLIAVLGGKDKDKAFLLVGVSSDLKDVYNAGKIIKELSKFIDGKGGGRSDMAQAGGNKTDKLEEALENALSVIESNK